MAYIDATDLAPYVDEATRTALFTDTVAGVDTYNATAYAEALLQASKAVDDALLAAGGSDGNPLTGTFPQGVIDAAVGAFLLIAYGRKGLTVPEAHLALTSLVSRIATGEYRVAGIAYSGTAGIGGPRFSESDPNVTDSRPQIFNSRALRTLW